MPAACAIDRTGTRLGVLGGPDRYTSWTPAARGSSHDPGRSSDSWGLACRLPVIAHSGIQDTPTPTYRCGGSAGLASRECFPRDAHLLPDYPFRQNGVRAPGRGQAYLRSDTGATAAQPHYEVSHAPQHSGRSAHSSRNSRDHRSQPRRHRRRSSGCDQSQRRRSRRDGAKPGSPESAQSPGCAWHPATNTSNTEAT